MHIFTYVCKRTHKYKSHSINKVNIPLEVGNRTQRLQSFKKISTEGSVRMTLFTKYCPRVESVCFHTMDYFLTQARSSKPIFSPFVRLFN